MTTPDKLKPKRQRQQVFQIRLNEAEKAELKARAERAGLTVAALIRQQCLDQPPPRASRCPPVERAELARLLAQLGRLKGDAYQIVRAINLQKGAIPGDDARAVIDAILDMRTALMKALGRDP